MTDILDLAHDMAKDLHEVGADLVGDDKWFICAMEEIQKLRASLDPAYLNKIFSND